jgi:hypothetical protein
MNTNEMSKVQTVALAKVIKDAVAKEASGGLVAGEYPVSFTVKVSGKVTKGDDYDQNIVAKADPWLLVAVLLSKVNGVTMDAVVRESVTQDPAMLDSLKASAAAAIEAIKAPTLTKCNGKVTTKLAVELVA